MPEAVFNIEGRAWVKRCKMREGPSPVFHAWRRGPYGPGTSRVFRDARKLVGWFGFVEQDRQMYEELTAWLREWDEEFDPMGLVCDVSD